MSRKVAHMLSNWDHKLNQNHKTNKVEPKRATPFLINIYDTLATFGLPRVTQKPSRIVKENGANNYITFNVCQLTNNLKKLPSGFHV